MSTTTTPVLQPPVAIPWLSDIEAARHLGLQPSTLRTYRARNAGPRYYRRGRMVRYRIADLDQWMAAEGAQ